MTDHVHVFDLVSGYCIRGCNGYREDGRVVSKSGAVFRSGHDEQEDEQCPQSR